MIRGPLGFRSLKFQADEFLSPARPIRWTEAGLLLAECYGGCQSWEPVANQAPPEDAIPGDACRCGIYATLNWRYALGYARQRNGLLTLTEGCGKYILYQDDERKQAGFRAEQGAVHWVVDTGATGDRIQLRALTEQHGAEFFGRQMLPLATALRLAKLQWERLGLEWPKTLPWT